MCGHGGQIALKLKGFFAPYTKSDTALCSTNKLTMLSEFVLMHTQRGKTAFTKQLLSQQLAGNTPYIPFFVLDNNTSLALQTQSALADLGRCLALHSLSSAGESNIRLHIHNYVQSLTQKTPIIMALNNWFQIPKMRRIMQHVKELGFSTLLVVDEADKTYPLCRDELYAITDRWIFVSATLGNLDRFPECAAATIKYAPLQNNSAYRGILSDGMKFTAYDTDGYKHESALACIRDNRDYFFTPVLGIDKVARYRKVLIHGTGVKEMLELMMLPLSLNGWGVICVVGIGTFAAKNGVVLEHVNKGKLSVSQTIEYLCKKHRLCQDRPLAVIGNRKMDRGITYHHAPIILEHMSDVLKSTILPTDIINYIMEFVEDDVGIIFTDCILGKVQNTDSAVQKAGRLAGNVGFNHEFISTLNWWSNSETINRIIKQCETIQLAQLEQPLCTTWNNRYKIIGPFKHLHSLNTHKFIVKNTQNNTLTIKTGAKLHRHAYNTSLYQAIELLNTVPIFAAKIQSLYYILLIQD